jgi:hypothetical protein
MIRLNVWRPFWDLCGKWTIGMQKYKQRYTAVSCKKQWWNGDRWDWVLAQEVMNLASFGG